MSEPKVCPMLFGFCKRGHPRTKESTFERRVTIRKKTGWVGEYVVRECRICHAIRNGGRSSNPTPKSKWSRYLADHTRRT